MGSVLSSLFPVYNGDEGSFCSFLKSLEGVRCQVL